MVGTAELLRFNRAQGQVISAASRDLNSVFSALDLARPELARDALLEAYPTIAGQYSDLSSTVAAEWYEDLRRSQVGGEYSALLAAAPQVERTERTVRWAASGLFSPEPWKAARLLEGSLTRLLGDSARETVSENVRRDPQAAGWQRNARADGCDFCVMLSSRVTERGGVYKKSTANFASHDNCRCTCSPSWDKDAPDMPVEAYRASESLVSLQNRASNPNLSARDRAKAQKQLDDHRARTRSWIESNRWILDDIRASS